MGRAFAGAAGFVALMIWANAASATAPEWYVRRNASNQMCSVQKADGQPLGRYFSEHDTRKEACQFAKARYSKPARDIDECPGFARGTVEICRVEGVKLPE